MSFLHPSPQRQDRERWLVIGIGIAVILYVSGGMCKGNAEIFTQAQRSDSLAFTLATAYRTQRAVTDSVTHASEARERRASHGRAMLDNANRSLAGQLATVREVLADTASDARLLRETLAESEQAMTRLQASVTAHLAQDVADSVARAREQAYWLTLAAMSDSALTVMTEARDEWKRVAMRSQRWPSKSQAFTIGAGLGMLGTAFLLR